MDLHIFEKKKCRTVSRQGPQGAEARTGFNLGVAALFGAVTLSASAAARADETVTLEIVCEWLQEIVAKPVTDQEATSDRVAYSLQVSASDLEPKSGGDTTFVADASGVRRVILPSFLPFHDGILTIYADGQSVLIQSGMLGQAGQLTVTALSGTCEVRE